MKTKSAKAKGIRLELEIAKTLRDAGLDPMAKKMPRSGAFMGFESDIHTSLPIMIECKNQETWKPLEYYSQAKEHSGVKIPIVVMSRNRSEPYAFLLWADVVELMAWALKGGWTGDMPFSKRKQVGK